MFHFELRQFPNVTRAFNLSREELDARILTAWVAGREVEVDDRSWSPGRAKLTILEGPMLAPEEMGIGRGWANAGRAGQEVTKRLLEEARSGQGPPGLEPFKQELLAWAAARAVPMPELVTTLSERYPGWRASDRLALAERAVWELLHAGQLRLLRDGEPLASEQWALVLLAWRSWTEPGISLIA